MPRNILISGADSLLGKHLVSHYLASSDDIIHCFRAGTLIAEELTSSMSQIVAEIITAPSTSALQAQLNSRLLIIPANVNCAPDLADILRTVLPVPEVWFLPPARYSDRRPDDADCASMLSSLLAVLPVIGAKTFNYVTDLWTGCETDRKLFSAEQEVCAQCKTHGISYRIFRASLIVGESAGLSGTCRDGFLRFLGTLHEIKTEIEERLPEYFEFRALRCYVPDPDTELNLIHVNDAVRLILWIVQHEGTPNREYRIRAREGIRFADLCDTVGMAYDLSLLPVYDRGALNAIDREFDARLEEFQSRCTSSPDASLEQASNGMDAGPEPALFNEQRQHAVFRAVRDAQDRARVSWFQRCANILGSLQKKTISKNASELTYHVSASAGTPVVLLNALGQGLHYWYRLIDNLMRYHRIVIWEPRGTVCPPPPFGLKDQVDDLAAILRHEGINTCHVVAWCTGPKVAMDFYLRQPETVLSMAFLNSTFKCLGGSEDLDTDYERNFEPLCRVLREHPNMAPSVMKSLQSSDEEEIDLLDEADNELLSRRVLALMNRDLKPYVRAPFQSASSVLNYAHQIWDFWSCDTTQKAGQINVPVLLVSSEHDRVASPAMSRMATQLFPQACHLHVQGATHYCLYDRPHFIAELLEAFFDDPVHLDARYARPEHRQVNDTPAQIQEMPLSRDAS